MRYEELPGPLEGWTYDENGVVYTTSGYRCDARHIEAALWLFGCFSTEARRYLIHSDEAAGALRPVYELSDLTARQKPTRLHRRHANGCHSYRSAPRARRPTPTRPCTETSPGANGNRSK